MKNISIFSISLNLILIIAIIYLLVGNKPEPVDLSSYERKIDSLNLALDANNKKLDSLSQEEVKYEESINVLKGELENLKDKNEKLKKQHDQEVSAINAMSNRDVATLFSESFE
jgi:predicted  nucleic acid-binding Zn-ribbon protein